MTSHQRIIVNTTAQYTRTILNVCLSLYATRLILAALGQMDYGIYSVVAGVVAMLGFITNALVTTTQRYLSYHFGKGDPSVVSHVFANSLLLHVLIGSGLMVILGALAYPIVYSVLQIEAGRETAAMVVYFAALLMLMLSFLTAPYRALFIARENIVYISVIDVLDGVLKLLIAVLLTFSLPSHDKLILYALLLVGISVFNLLAFAGYAHRRFDECHLPRWREFDRRFIRELSGFAGWTVYSTGCIIARTQGVAIILNRIFGSMINAAYGVAQQVSGAVQFVAQSVLNAMTPQVIKAEGAGDRQHMLSLAEASSKYATLLMAMVVIPLSFEMPEVLRVWLRDVPDHAVMFCRFVLIASACDQLTIGLGTANQAIGNIRNYSLVVNTIKVMTLPVAWLCLHVGLLVDSVMWSFLAIEIICAMTRLPFLKITAGLQIGRFVMNVFVRSLAPVCAMTAACYAVVQYVDAPYRFILTLLISGVTGVIMIWLTALKKNEKDILRTMIVSKISKQ